MDAFVIHGSGDAGLEVCCQIDGHLFGEESRAGPVAGQLCPGAGLIASLFGKLAPSGLEDILTGVYLAGREFPDVLLGGEAVLADQQYLFLVINDQDDGRTGVMYYGAPDLETIGRLGNIFGYAEEIAAVFLF